MLDQRELKQRILRGPELPALSHAAWEALCLPTADPSELAAIVSFDPLLSDRVLQDARAAGDPRVREVEDAMEVLGSEEARASVLRHALVALFPPEKGNRLDRYPFWRNALDTAAYAADIARRTGIPFAHDAYAAGLLHNIGMLALDLAAPEGYPKALEAAHGKGLFVLEAERQELGADHTLAGKWLAERWGLPDHLVAALWLHHHPEGALDHTAYPVPLIDAVALAGLLARRRTGGDSGAGLAWSSVEARAQRLGLSRAVLEELRGKRPPVHSLRKVYDTPPPSEPTASMDRFRALERQAGRYRVLYETALAWPAARGAAEVLHEAAKALRDGMGIRAGLCYAIDSASTTILAALWRPGAPEVLAITLPLEPGQDHEDSQVERHLLSLLREIEVDGGTKGRAPKTAPGALLRHGLMAIPMTVDGKSLGQIVFDAGATGFRPAADEMNALMAFSEACGRALSTRRSREDLETQAESLGEALWKREMTQRKQSRGERLASVARMAAGAAHEINNPLAIISGRAQILLSHVTDPGDAQSLKTIIEQSRRASRVLNDLMQFARPARPKLAPLDAGAVLRQAGSAAKARLEASGIVLREAFSGVLPPVEGDVVQLEQVLAHLIANAEEAMAHQGGVLTLSARPSREHNSMVIQVADTGHGIPSDILGDVFEPFFTTREGGAHTGLGLSVCHGIVENHRGGITIHSKPGEGTTVTITLPAAQSLPASVEPGSLRAAQVRPSARSKRCPDHSVGRSGPGSARSARGGARSPGVRGAAHRRSPRSDGHFAGPSHRRGINRSRTGHHGRRARVAPHPSAARRRALGGVFLSPRRRGGCFRTQTGRTRLS